MPNGTVRTIGSTSCWNSAIGRLYGRRRISTAIEGIDCPVLLVLGSDDDPRRLKQAEVMRDAHERTEIVVVEGGRHAVHKDHAAEVVAAIDAFLSRPTRAVPGPPTWGMAGAPEAPQ